MLVKVFQKTMLFARLFHGAAMDYAEDAGCRCRVPRCRVPLQNTEMQGAVAEYRGAGSRVWDNGSCRGCRVLLLNAAVQSATRAAKNPRSRIHKPSTSNLEDPHFSHPTCAGPAPFRSAIAGHQIWQFKISQRIFFYTQLSCPVYVCVCAMV